MSQPMLADSDKPRLRTQLQELASFYRRYPLSWFSLKELAGRIGASEAGASARLRDLRNKLGWAVEKRIRKSPGLYEYHATPPGEPTQLSIL